VTKGEKLAGDTDAGAAAADRFARTDGCVPIESCGMIGDALDPQVGDCFTLEPAVPHQVKRRYLPGTSKQQLIDQACANYADDEALAALNGMPEREYSSPDEISQGVA
jgi:hypothetical protein